MGKSSRNDPTSTRRSQRHRCFAHGEVISQAATRPCAEGKVISPPGSRTSFGGEPVGIEDERVRPRIGVVMQGVYHRHQRQRASLDATAIDCDVLPDQQTRLTAGCSGGLRAMSRVVQPGAGTKYRASLQFGNRTGHTPRLARKLGTLRLFSS